MGIILFGEEELLIGKTTSEDYLVCLTVKTLREKESLLRRKKESNNETSFIVFWVRRNGFRV
jgi:hypothetical protein